MKGIFISYRREDSAGYAGRLYDRLASHFGPERVFMDVEGIEPGVDFVEAIERAVASCEVLIVIIGHDWLAADSAGKRRLDDPADFVRIETAAALARGIRVVPVLVDNAVMPRADQLPPELVLLVRRQAVELSHKQWDATSAELIKTLEKVLDGGKPRSAADTPVPAGERHVPEAVASSEARAAGPRSPRRYWAVGALSALAVTVFGLYLTQPWKKAAEPAPRPGHLVVSPSKLQFPDQPPRDAGASATVTLGNDGGAPLRVGKVELGGPSAVDFTLSEDQCSGRSLAPGASCSVKVGFSPKAPGARSASLAFLTDPPSTIALEVEGRGSLAVAEAPRPADKDSGAPGPAVKSPETARPADKASESPSPRPTPPPPEPKPEAPPPPPRIVNFEARIVDGRVQLCYGVENATSVAISPSPGAVKPLSKECVLVAASTTRVYTLTARNAAGTAVTRAINVEAPPSPPPPALVAVPSLLGRAQRDAVAELDKAGLEARIVEDKLEPGASGPPGSVVAQLPKAGEQLKAGGRVTLQIMPASAPVATLPSALPRVGDVWEYRLRSIWRNVEPRTYTHQVTAVSEREVRETMRAVSSADNASESKAFGPDTRFVEWRGKGYYFVEFNPFLEAFGELRTPGTKLKLPAMPAEDPYFGNWASQGRIVGWDSVSVPAGTFKALRFEINSNRAPTGSVAMRGNEPVRVLHVIWFAPDAKRTAKVVRTVYSTSGTRLDEDTYELVKYRVQ